MPEVSRQRKSGALIYKPTIEEELIVETKKELIEQRDELVKEREIFNKEKEEIFNKLTNIEKQLKIK